jgi:hypothetical protein
MDTFSSTLSSDITVYEGERAIQGIICTATPDSQGEVLMPSGCVTKEFERNPIVKWRHGAENANLPIGLCAGLQRGQQMLAKTVFAKRPDDHPQAAPWLPDTLFALCQQGIVKGFSVHGTRIEARPANSVDKEKYGPACKLVTSKWRLDEYSLCDIGVNPEALITAISKCNLEPAQAMEWFGVAVPAVPEPEPSVIEKTSESFILVPPIEPEPMGTTLIITRPPGDSRDNVVEFHIDRWMQKHRGSIYYRSK